MEIKISKSEELIHNKTIITYYANNIAVCRVKKYSEMFCTVKNGVRSNIRDKSKKAFETCWIKSGLIELTGISELTVSYSKPADFKDSYPDTSWGSQGVALNAKQIKENIKNFILSKNHENC